MEHLQNNGHNGPNAVGWSAGLLVVCAALAACSADSGNVMGDAMSPATALDAGLGVGPVASQGDGAVSSDGAMASSPTSEAGTGMGMGTSAAGADTGAVSVPDAASASDAALADASTDAGPVGPVPTTADFAKPGAYGMSKRLVNQGVGTVTTGSSGLLGDGTNDPSGFTLFFPANAKSGERLPLLTFGNGTFCMPTFYDELIGFIVSYGYVVIASNTSNAGSGAEMLKAVEWALAQNDAADSPIHGMVDGEHIGSFGHSQGGEGSVETGADPRIDAIAPLSAGPMGDGEAKIHCPAFYTLTENDVVSPESYRPSYDATKTPSILGVTQGGDHDDYSDKADDPGIPGLTSNDGLRTRAAIVAWFEWQLKGKSAIKALFVGKDCGFCRDANWKTFESKGF